MLGHILKTAVDAVLPIMILIGIGCVLKRMGMMNEIFIKTGQKLVFRLLLPCMLFLNVYGITGMNAIRWDIVIYCTALLLVLFGLGGLLGNVATKDPRRKGVIWQCSFRSNFAIIGLPLATTLGGSDGAAVAAVLSAITVPLFNVLSIVALTAFVSQGNKKRRTAGDFLLEVAKNPLIIGVLLGLTALAIRGAQQACFGEVVFSLERDAKAIYQALSYLKAAATPLALIVLGGQFEFSAVKGMGKEIVIGTLARILAAPLLAITLAVALSRNTTLLQCGNGELAALIAQFGSPVAVSSAIAAGSMDNDEQLAAQLVVWTSIGSVLTIFLTVCILMGSGLLRI